MSKNTLISKEKYNEYDKTITKSLSYLMQLFPNKKLIIGDINLDNENDLYWFQMLNILQVFGGEIYFSRNIFKYLKICRKFKNVEIKFTIKKGKKIANIHNNFVNSDFVDLPFNSNILEEIYKEYYKLGE